MHPDGLALIDNLLVETGQRVNRRIRSRRDAGDILCKPCAIPISIISPALRTTCCRNTECLFKT